MHTSFPQVLQARGTVPRTPRPLPVCRLHTVPVPPCPTTPAAYHVPLLTPPSTPAAGCLRVFLQCLLITHRCLQFAQPFLVFQHLHIQLGCVRQGCGHCCPFTSELVVTGCAQVPQMCVLHKPAFIYLEVLALGALHTFHFQPSALCTHPSF